MNIQASPSPVFNPTGLGVQTDGDQRNSSLSWVIKCLRALGVDLKDVDYFECFRRTLVTQNSVQSTQEKIKQENMKGTPNSYFASVLPELLALHLQKITTELKSILKTNLAKYFLSSRNKKKIIHYFHSFVE